MVEVAPKDVSLAFMNWKQFCKNKDLPIILQAFLDFLDPVRQTDLQMCASYEPNGDFLSLTVNDIVVTEQIKRRIDLLVGPHYHAMLSANWQRFNHAHESWGKKRVRVE